CSDAAGMAQENQPVRRLEPGKPIERELAGGQSHTYQLTLADGQYVNLVVDQRGIDVVVKLFGPDGKAIMEFDSESRAQGQESVSVVAEAGGSYRLSVQPKLNRAAAGRYEIRIEALRVATDDDRALYEASKLVSECVRLRSAGKFDEALPLAERAVEILERVLGPVHCEVALAINHLAELYSDKGEYGKAEPLYKRTLPIIEKSLGEDHPSTAENISDLAVLYHSQGKYAEAEPLYKRALDIREKALGKEHPDTATSIDNLALLYRAQGKYAEAESLYKRALDIRERELGKDHPDT